MNFKGQICALLCVILFGSNFAIIKEGVSHIPPLFLSSMRLLLLGGVLVWFVQVPQKNTLIRLFALSMTQFTLNYGLTAMGLHDINAGIASILTQLEVPFAVLLGFLFFKEKLTFRQLLGCSLAFMGSLFIIEWHLDNVHAIGMLMVTGGGFVYALSCFQARNITELNASTLTAWCALLAAPQLLLMSFFYENISMATITHNLPYFSYVVLTAAFSGIAFVLWTKLIKTYSVSQVMPVALLIPFTGVAAGVIFLHETLTLKIMMGGMITVVGISLVILKEWKVIRSPQPSGS